MELLTQEIARAYRDRAKALPDNGTQDLGKRRELRRELQERCGLTELEAINIINGFQIDDYCRKYLINKIKAQDKSEGEPGPPKGKRRRQYRNREIY